MVTMGWADRLTFGMFCDSVFVAAPHTSISVHRPGRVRSQMKVTGWLLRLLIFIMHALPLSALVTCVGFDFISTFGLDRPDAEVPGVRVIKGSNQYQKAYKVGPRADLRIPTRYVI